MKPLDSCASSPSFTLVEILVATAILSILMAIMFGILQQTSAGWQAANRRVEASQVARLAMDQIASDLENCVAVAQANVALPRLGGTTTNYAYGFVHANQASAVQSWLVSSGDIKISEPNDYIFVVTPYLPSLNLGTGDLCEVGYIPIFVSKQDGYSTMRGGRYVLLRHMPLQFSAGNETVTNAQPVNDFITQANWHETPTGVSTTNRVPFVDNCLKFNVQFFYTNSGGVLVTNATWGKPTVTGANASWVGNPAGIQGLPLGAVITMCVVDERSAERLNRLSSGNALSAAVISSIPTNWSAVPANLRSTLQTSVLTLERRIYFKNRTNQ